MGGHVTVVVRSKDGGVIARSIDAGQVSPLCQNRPFLEERRTTLGDGFRGGSGVEVGPAGYGLVVVDRQSRWFGHCQGFCDPTWWSNHYLDDTGTDLADPWNPRGRLVAAWKQGCIRHVRRFATPESGGAVAVPLAVPLADLDILTLEDLLVHLDSHRPRWDRGEPREGLTAGVLFEPPGWQFERFNASAVGWIALADAMLDRNFDFSGQDAAQWAEFTHDAATGAVNPLQMKARRMAADLDRILPSTSAHPTVPRAPRL